jgi:crotonobetainyl-CoA:carnitine CoA-transferase CaiB-like acyl-CoA transferase
LPGWEGIVAARFGLLAGQIGRRPGPSFQALPIGSYGAAVLALSGMMAALVRRDRLGTGCRVHTSLLSGMVFYGSAGFLQLPPAFRAEFQPTIFRDEDPLGGVPGFHLARCKDGRWIQLAVLNRPYWERAVVPLGMEWTLQDERYKGGPRSFTRDEDRAGLVALTREVMATRTADEWLERFDRYDVPAGPSLTAGEFVEQPQVRASGFIAQDDGRRDLGRLFTISAYATGEPDRKAAEDETAAGAGPAPLAGLRVIDLSAFVAAPAAARTLAELGADVIKVESIEGESYRNQVTSFMGGNRGKRSLSIDLKAPEGKRILYELVRGADVVLENFRTGVVERLGIDWPSLRAINQRLVYCELTPWGTSGPYVHRATWDPFVSAVGAIETVQGGGEEPVSEFRADLSGGLATLAGILTALQARSRTGRGQLVQATMLGSLVHLNSRYLTEAGTELSPMVDYERNGIDALYRLYRCESGWVFLACVTEKERDRLWRYAEAAAPGIDVTSAEFLQAMFERQDAESWEAELLPLGIPAVRADLRTDARDGLVERHLRENGFIVESPHPLFGSVVHPGRPIRLPDNDQPITSEPQLGEHTAEILAGIGVSREELERLRAARVVY